MSVENTTAVSGPYTANGVTTVFPFTFQAASADEVGVSIDGADVTTGFTVSVLKNGTGSVTFATAPASGTLYIISKPLFNQEADFQRFGPYFPDTLNEPLDRAAKRDIYLRYRVDKLFPKVGTSIAALVGKFLSWDANGNPIVSSGTGADGGLRTDLAASTGADMVGAAGGGSVQAVLDALKTGFRTNGQALVSTTSSLVFATHAGKVVLATVAGITITVPATGFASGNVIALSNVSTGAITLVFPGGSDAATTLQAGKSVFLHSDGGGYWRSLFANNREGIRSTGQVVITGSTSLTSALHSGANLLLGTAGITITLPATGFAVGECVTLSNVSGGALTLAYPGGGDGPTTLLAGGSLQCFSDGAGFWRSYFYSPGTTPVASNTGNNYFPNTQWQINSATGPGWDGGAGTLNAYLDAFEGEQNWFYSGVLSPNITVTNIAVATDASGQKTVTAQGDSAVQFLYPDALIAFTPASIAASVANPALLQSTMRVLTVNYTNLTFTFYPPRNGLYSGGSGPVTGAVNYVCRQVMGAGTNSVGSGNGPDGWTKSADAKIWIDRWPNISGEVLSRMTYSGGASAPNKPAWASNLRASMKRALVIVPASLASFFVASYNGRQAVQFRGRTIVWGAWVKGVAGKTIRLAISSTGVLQQYSTAVTATGSWQWVEWSYAVPATTVDLNVGFEFPSSVGSAWAIGEPRLDFGTAIGEGNYVLPRGVVQPFISQVVPDSYFGADITIGTGHRIDWFGETGGKVAGDIVTLHANLEGTGSAAGKLLFIRSAPAAPTRYGASMFAYGAFPNAQAFTIAIDDGTSWMSGTAADVWGDISIDMNYAVLA